MATVLGGDTLTVWKFGRPAWIAFALAMLLIATLYRDGIHELIKIWSESQEYSHGFLIPLISAFLVWQNKDRLQSLDLRGSWWGVVVCIAGVCLYFLGELSTLYIIVHYSILVVLAGLILAIGGWPAMRILWVPLVFLAFMIPLPGFIYQGLSSKLQLWSSELGVAVIRLFGITVFLEGNVIDLGSYKLQVVEACNGLRYLFPLMSFGFLCAYLFKAPLWKRAVIFLSTIPITVLMNSFRIGVIGVLVEYWGTDMAEGFLHDFEGWVVFMACIGTLMLEMWLLMRVTGDRRSLTEAFGVELPARTPSDARVVARPLSKPTLTVVVVLAIATLSSFGLAQRAEAIPSRTGFAEFPMRIGTWEGRTEQMEQIYLDALKLTDYIIADYGSGADDLVNFYVAYYNSQRTGGAIHSPRACIPGGGWEIRDHEVRTIPAIEIGGRPLAVNRIAIQMGQNRQLVYYWFQQRGRILTSEYLVKWYLFWDALTRNRTDGALVRLTTPVAPAEDITDADDRLIRFAQEVSGALPQYIPN